MAKNTNELPTPKDVKSGNLAAFEAIGWKFTYYPAVRRPSVVVLAGLETALKAKA